MAERADTYRLTFEPLFIADYCQYEETPYLAPADDGSALKRPKRYWYIEQRWAELQPGKPHWDSTAWARAYQQQVEQQVAVGMQGKPPVERVL